MSFANKILLGCIAVFSLVFLYFAMANLQAQNSWRKAHNATVKSLEQEQARTEQLTGELGEPPGLLQAQGELHKVLVGRGRVWRGVAPGAVDPAGTVSVTVDNPAPHQLTDKLVLYVFDDRPLAEGGAYLGEFTVAQVTDKQVALTPNSRLSEAEVAKLKQAAGPWTLYDVMPPDSHSLFAAVTEDEVKALFPGDASHPYLKDGKPAEPTDPAMQVQNGNYVRQLNDYAVLFREVRRLRSLYIDLIAAAQRDKQYIENALADTKQDEQFRLQEIADLKVELAKYAAERDAVKAFRESLDASLAETGELIAQLEADNKRLAAQYAAWQIETARQADDAAARALGPGAGNTRPPASSGAPRAVSRPR